MSLPKHLSDEIFGQIQILAKQMSVLESRVDAQGEQVLRSMLHFEAHVAKQQEQAASPSSAITTSATQKTIAEMDKLTMAVEPWEQAVSELRESVQSLCKDVRCIKIGKEQRPCNQLADSATDIGLGGNSLINSFDQELLRKESDEKTSALRKDVMSEFHSIREQLSILEGRVGLASQLASQQSCTLDAEGENIETEDASKSQLGLEMEGYGALSHQSKVEVHQTSQEVEGTLISEMRREIREWGEEISSRIQTNRSPAVHTESAIVKQVDGRYKLEHSIYDSLFLVHVWFVNTSSSVYIIIGFLLHISMLIVTLTIVAGEEFAEEPFRNPEYYRRWRAEDGHAASMANSLTHMSLVARVCNDDVGLSVADSQRALVYEARKYLDMGTPLCNVAAFLWLCCCAEEWIQIIDFLAALYNIPKSRKTDFSEDDDGAFFVEISRSRFLLGIFIAASRMAICGALAYCGCIWLVNTTHLETLLLNASALGFVLDIDNTIFRVVAPSRVVSLIDDLKPLNMKVTKLVKFKRKFLHVLVIASMICLNFWPMSHIRNLMNDVIEIICEPEDSHQMVQAQNALGWVLYTTDEGMSWENRDQSVDVDIVAQLVQHPNGISQHAYKVAGFTDLILKSSQTVEEFVENFGCHDMNTVDLTSTTLGERLWAATANASLRTLTSCRDTQPYCRDLGTVGNNVRFMCAESCGCVDLYSGLWDLARPEYGCPRSCRFSMTSGVAFTDMECRDLTIPELRSTGWQDMLDRMAALRDISVSNYLNLTSIGCEALANTNMRDTCTFSHGISNYGASTFCPVSCRCSSAVSLQLATRDCAGLCPTSCCSSDKQSGSMSSRISSRAR